MRRLLIILALLLLVAGGVMLMARRTVPDWTTDSPEALAALERGLDAQMKFYGYEAKRGYQEAIELDPDFVAAKVMVLLRSYGWQDKQELVEQLRAADLDHLTDRERFLVRYVLARNDGDDESANRILEDFFEAHPNDPYPLSMYSNRAWEERDWEKAERYYRRLLELDPNWVSAQNHLGYMAMAQGRFDEAEQLFETYQFIAPDQANPHDSMGELLTALGRYDEAAAALEKALEVKPDFCASYEHLFALATLAGNGVAYPEIVARSREHCGERSAEVMGCFAELWTDYMQRDFDAPWGEDREACRKIYVRESFLLHRLAVLTGRDETARELEELTAKRSKKGGMESAISEGFLLHMKGVRALAAGEHERAASYLSKADRLLLYWGQGPAILKMFNQMALAAALEGAGKQEKAEAVLAKVRQVNPRFADSYPAIRSEFGG
jgi:tetratricopeptide (TPR) repeat protein